MEQQILGTQDDFQIVVDNSPKTPQDLFFSHVAQAFQEIVVDEQFEKSQAGFMRSHCQIFDKSEQNKKEYMPIFSNYQKVMNECLEKVTDQFTQMLSSRVQSFNMEKFIDMLPSRVQQIDQEIYEILTSLSDFQIFKDLMLDYKDAQEQEQRHRALTVKSTKVPQNKKSKAASDNIFTNTKTPNFDSDLHPKKKTNGKKQKSQQEILVPDLVLTVRPLRKA